MTEADKMAQLEKLGSVNRFLRMNNSAPDGQVVKGSGCREDPGKAQD